MAIVPEVQRSKEGIILGRGNAVGSRKVGQSSWKQPLSRSGGKRSSCWFPHSQTASLKAVCAWKAVLRAVIAITPGKTLPRHGRGDNGLSVVSILEEPGMPWQAVISTRSVPAAWLPVQFHLAQEKANTKRRLQKTQAP